MQPPLKLGYIFNFAFFVASENSNFKCFYTSCQKYTLFSNMWCEQQILIIIVEVLWYCEEWYRPTFKTFPNAIFPRQNQHCYPHPQWQRTLLVIWIDHWVWLQIQPLALTKCWMVIKSRLLWSLLMVLHRINMKAHFTKPGTWLIKTFFLSSYKFCKWANI